jgi:hypothetical protein
MLSTTAKYIYTVYRLKSVSLAAQELFISQPALSRAIKKAETELGAPIFNRKTLPFSLTAEGKLYIDAIEKILQIEKEAEEKIGDIRHIHGGTLRIATSTHLSFYVIPKVLKEFHKKHPQVDIHIIVTDTDKLYEHLEKETADLIFISGAQAPEEYRAVELLEEKFVVAMPRNMVTESLLPYSVNHEELISGRYDKNKEITDMAIFHGIEFIYSPPNTGIQKKRKILFGKSDIAPYITSNAGRQQLNYNLMCSGFGALFTTDANIATMPPDSKCAYFILGGPAAKQSFSVVYPQKDSESIVKEFVNTAKTLLLCENTLKQLAND